MPASPFSWPHDQQAASGSPDVLQALAQLGTIAHPRKGYYARDWPPEDMHEHGS